MHTSSSSVLVAGLLTLRLVFASPLPSTHLAPRQLVDCDDLSATADPSCWSKLGVSNYLMTNWTSTARTCTGSTDDALCCAETELWANCFIRLAMGPPDGLDDSSSDADIHCDQIGNAACTSDFIIKVIDYPAQARYVVIAIQCKFVHVRSVLKSTG